MLWRGGWVQRPRKKHRGGGEWIFGSTSTGWNGVEETAKPRLTSLALLVDLYAFALYSIRSLRAHLYSFTNGSLNSESRISWKSKNPFDFFNRRFLCLLHESLPVLTKKRTNNYSITGKQKVCCRKFFYIRFPPSDSFKITFLTYGVI